MAFVKKFWRCEEGIVESTLVLIPLMVLFLVAAGLIISVNFRNLDLAYAQTDATSGAITSVISSDDEIVSFSSRFSFDSLRLLVTHSRRTVPNVIPDLPFLNGGKSHSTDVIGIAVIEKQP
jgi:hypothetical protein